MINQSNRKRTKIAICLFITTFIGAAHLSFADGPWEKFHIPYNETLKQVLKETIGIITLNSGGQETGTTIITFKLTDNQFSKEKILKVRGQTTSVSKVGYRMGEPPIYKK